MKSYLKGVSLAVLIACTAPVLQAEESKSNVVNPIKAGGTSIEAVSVTATVESINYETRKVDLKKDSGEIVSLTVGPAARNFNQIKKGDKVTFDFLEAVAIDVRKATGEPEMDIEVAMERSPLGAKPSGIVSETVTLKALVEKIDYDTRQVTLKGPEGNLVTMKVGEQAKRFNEVKKGDEVVVVYTEALGISVTTPKG